jgi:hypothetical protein
MNNRSAADSRQSGAISFSSSFKFNSRHFSSGLCFWFVVICRKQPTWCKRQIEMLMITSGFNCILATKNVDRNCDEWRTHLKLLISWTFNFSDETWQGVVTSTGEVSPPPRALGITKFKKICDPLFCRPSTFFVLLIFFVRWNTTVIFTSYISPDKYLYWFTSQFSYRLHFMTFNGMDIRDEE